MNNAGAMKQALDQEIKWCRANRGKSGKGPDFEEGFLAGLKQAKRLLAALPKTEGIYCVACCEECRHGNCFEMCEKCRILAKNKKKVVK